jgi:hypothetical protein
MNYLSDNNKNCLYRFESFIHELITRDGFKVDIAGNPCRTYKCNQFLSENEPLNTLNYDEICWTENNYLGVKVPDVTILGLEKNETFNDMLDKMDDDQAAVMTALNQAFYTSSLDVCEEINFIISNVSKLKSLSQLTTQQSKLIIHIIDTYEREIYGWDTSEWFGKLRPLINERIDNEEST